MAEYLDRIRKLSSLLFIVSAALVFVIIQIPSGLPIHRPLVYTILLSIVIAGTLVYRFPWELYHPNLFLPISGLAIFMLSLLIAASGGPQSPFFPIFVFIVVASGAYYGTLPLSVVTTLACLGSLSYVLYSRVTREDLLSSVVEITVYAVSALICNLIFRGLERSTREAKHHAAVVALLHSLDQRILGDTKPGPFAEYALERLLHLVPFDLGAIGTVVEDAETLSWIAIERRDPAMAPPPLSGEQLRRCLTAVHHGPMIGPGGGEEDLPGLGNGSWLLVGLLSAETPTGLLLLARRRRDPWTTPDLATTVQVASQVTIGIEQSRLTEQAARIEAQAALAQMSEQFVAQVNHDLRNPLARIVASSELLCMRALPADTVSVLNQEIHRSALQVQEYVDELLDVTRLTHARPALQRETVNLGSLIHETVDAVFRPNGRHKIETDGTGSLPPVMLDRHRMKQVLANLIGNAIKYSPNGGTIRINCEETDSRIVIRVSDEGIGIPPEALPRVFDKFYRASNELGRGILGTGLGLAIVKQLVEAHGGEVSVESAGIGKGSTFTVRLPKIGPPAALIRRAS